MPAYYNEFDPYKALWIQELIKMGLIADGEVDTRSIVDVQADELMGFTQCHFFAGIAVWSCALRQAGWSDDRPVWTGSCPCQSFSAAGKSKGFDDPRHLWPAWFNLLRECRPDTIFGEQVEAAIRHGWLDLVQTDLEREGYAFGSVVWPAAGIGSPHIRSRLYWVANAKRPSAARHREHGGDSKTTEGIRDGLTDCVEPCRLANTNQGSHRTNGGCLSEGQGTEGRSHVSGHTAASLSCRLANTQHPGHSGTNADEAQQGSDRAADGISGGSGCELCGGLADAYEPGLQPWERDDQAERYWHTVAAKSFTNQHGHPGPTNGHWRDVDWLLCRDGKWRPTESWSGQMAPGTSDSLGYRSISGRYSLDPLKKDAKNRKLRLHGYGDAIVAPQAEAFVRAHMEVV